MLYNFFKNLNPHLDVSPICMDRNGGNAGARKGVGNNNLRAGRFDLQNEPLYEEKSINNIYKKNIY